MLQTPAIHHDLELFSAVSNQLVCSICSFFLFLVFPKGRFYYTQYLFQVNFTRLERPELGARGAVKRIIL